MISFFVLRLIKIRFLYILFFIVCFIAVMTERVCSIEKKSPYHVLVLSSYHQEYTWTANIIKGIQEVFSESGMDVEISYEFLDAKRYAETRAYRSKKTELLKYKYKKRPVDLVLLSDNSAFYFVSEHRSQIFPKAPVVFCGINNYSLKMHKKLPNSTGVMERKDMDETLELMMSLHSNTENIFIISDTTKTGKIDAGLMKSALIKMGKVKFTELSGNKYSLEEMLVRLRKVPDRSLVFFCSFWRDKFNNAYKADEILPMIAEQCRVPVYTHADIFVIGGVTGGIVVNGHNQGILAGKMAIRILKGALPSSIPVESESNKPMFDYRALKRWGIDFAKIPAGALVINSPSPSFYEENVRIIWGVIGAFIIQFLFITGLIINTISRHKAEKQLRLSRQRMDLALEGADMGAWDWDIPADHALFDSRWTGMLGYGIDDISPDSQGFRQLIHPEDKPVVSKKLQDYLDGKIGDYKCEMRMRHRNGQWRWILSRGRVFEKNDQGDPKRMCGVHIDITERKEAEKAIRLSKENLRITLDSIGDAVISTDINGNISRINPVAEKLTGWSACDAVGQPLGKVFNIVNSESRLPAESPVKKVMASGEIVGLANHTLLLSREGKEFHISDSGAPILNNLGEIIGVVLVFRDVTEEYRLQERLRQSEKMDAIGQLAGGVAHDFNNMLGGIMGAIDILSSRLTDRPDTHQLLKIIVDSSERAADLTRELLTFSRKQPVASTPVDVTIPLKDALKLLERTVDKRIKLEINIPDDSFQIIGEPSQLQSMFMNLLINASHAMPEGGTIYVALSSTEVDEYFNMVLHGDIVPGEYVDIEIRDTGSGIHQKDLCRIFEPFFTTKGKGKGTGLGLASVIGNVQQHGGAINVYSEVGVGTSFHIFLPLTQDCAKNINRKIIEPVHGNGHIMVVEDEAVMRTTATVILEDLGYTVVSAENGLQALEIFRNIYNEVDLVILDMVMPEMNGRDCFIEMQKIDPDLRVLFTSGFACDDTLRELKSAGIKGGIHKPYRSSMFSQAVYKALNN